MQSNFRGDFHLKGLSDRSMFQDITTKRYFSEFKGFGDDYGKWDWARRSGEFKIGF